MAAPFVQCQIYSVWGFVPFEILQERTEGRMGQAMKDISIFDLMSDYEDSEIEMSDQEYVSIDRGSELVKRKVAEEMSGEDIE